MVKLELGLPFFASLWKVDEDELSYTIVMRKETIVVKLPNGKEKKQTTVVSRRPAIKVLGITSYVYDLIDGQFIELGQLGDDAKIVTAKTVYFVRTKEGFVLRDEEGRTVTYTIRDFEKRFAFRVVNPALYKHD